MAYIGSIPAYQASGVRPRDEFTADGTQICFPLSQSVPGSFESGVTIVLDNVPQQPVEAFTVVDTRTLTLTSISGTFTVNETVTGTTSAATGTVLKVNLNNIIIRGLTGTFSSSETITGGSSSATATTTSVTINTGSGILFSEAPTAASVIYVVHEGNATYNLVPTAASVGPSQLADNLRNFTVDTFTGDGTTTTFTLSDTPSSANSLLVMVDGIVQTRTTNYTLSGAVVTFTDAPDSSAAITIIHLGFSTISRTGLVDGSVTTAKIADNAITSAKLGFDVIVAEDIAANAITVSEIQNGAVTPAKLSTGGPAWDADGNVSTQSGGDLTFTGTGNRITGDFSNATGANRVAFQTSTTNGNTILNVIPNGTATNTQLRLFNAADPDNASIAQYIALSGTEVRIASAIAGTGTYLPLTMYTGGSERLRITTAGVVELTSGQLKFPATQSASADANTLDDYEEGSFTPTLGGSGNSFTTTSSGNYIKVGNSVTVMIKIQWSAKSGSSGVTIALPFMPAGERGGFSIGMVTASTIVSSSQILYAQVDGGVQTINLRYSNNGASWSAFTPSNMGTSGEIHVAGSYIV